MRWGPLTGSPDFALYWSARTVSIAGNQIVRVALTVLVYQLGAGPAGVSVLLLALTVPRLLGPLAGAIADRSDNKRLMIACDVVQAALFAPASFVRWWPGVIATVLAATAVSTLYLPAGRGNIPVLAGRDNLARANAQLAIGSNAALALGRSPDGGPGEVPVRGARADKPVIAFHDLGRGAAARRHRIEPGPHVAERVPDPRTGHWLTQMGWDHFLVLEKDCDVCEDCEGWPPRPYAPVHYR